VGAQPGVQLGDLATDRRHPARVFEQTSGVAVVAVDGGRKRAQLRPQIVVADEAPDRGLQPGVDDLGSEKLEEAYELVGIPPKRGRQLGRVEIVDRLERADLELEAIAEPVHAAEHTYRVALAEPAVE